MPYSEFSLKKVKKDFDLNILEVPTFISAIPPVKPSPSLAQFLEKYLPLALALNRHLQEINYGLLMGAGRSIWDIQIADFFVKLSPKCFAPTKYYGLIQCFLEMSNTEKARSEMIICPILLEIKDIFDRQISLFSSNEFTVDQSLGLNGVCDFLISKSPEQLFIEAPAIIVVEAKQEDLNGGLGQCVAEMVAAGRFNQKDGNFCNPIYGCVTTGNLWKFIKLEEQTVTIGLREYPLPPTEEILGILVSFIGE